MTRGLKNHPVLVYGLITVTAAHLLNWIPLKFDPYWWIYLIYQTITKGYV